MFCGNDEKRGYNQSARAFAGALRFAWRLVDRARVEVARLGSSSSMSRARAARGRRHGVGLASLHSGSDRRKKSEWTVGCCRVAMRKFLSRFLDESSEAKLPKRVGACKTGQGKARAHGKQGKARQGKAQGNGHEGARQAAPDGRTGNAKRDGGKRSKQAQASKAKQRRSNRQLID